MTGPPRAFFLGPVQTRKRPFLEGPEEFSRSLQEDRRACLAQSAHDGVASLVAEAVT